MAQGAVVQLKSNRGSASGLVVAETSFNGGHAWRLLVPELSRCLPTLADGNDVGEAIGVTIGDPPEPALTATIEELNEPSTRLIGLLTEGSAIDSAFVELFGPTSVNLGQVLWTRVGDRQLLWQVTNAELSRHAWAGDTRRIVKATAAQIGLWDSHDVTFESHLASPNISQPVFSGQIAAPPVGTVVGHLVRVGSLPQSPFPVMVDIAQLSRSHGAILGTTGTGKTHLSFALVRALRARGVKVVCLDQTGQYLSCFPDAEEPGNVAGLKTFLASDKTMAIMRPSGMSPIKFANQIVRATLEWATAQGTLDADLLARCVVLLEEAQNFIPETFVVNEFELKAAAQDTSLVVMEGRKFGLGFLLVSQRTAMITKSALSQCNTVFAFQASDQTGLDYLGGLCGRALVQSIPLLPHRTSIAMGRAVRSRAPLITFVDQAEVIVG